MAPKFKGVLSEKQQPLSEREREGVDFCGYPACLTAYKKGTICGLTLQKLL